MERGGEEGVIHEEGKGEEVEKMEGLLVIWRREEDCESTRD